MQKIKRHKSGRWLGINHAAFLLESIFVAIYESKVRLHVTWALLSQLCHTLLWHALPQLHIYNHIFMWDFISYTEHCSSSADSVNMSTQHYAAYELRHAYSDYTSLHDFWEMCNDPFKALHSSANESVFREQSQTALAVWQPTWQGEHWVSLVKFHKFHRVLLRCSRFCEHADLELCMLHVLIQISARLMILSEEIYEKCVGIDCMRMLCCLNESEFRWEENRALVVWEQILQGKDWVNFMIFHKLHWALLRCSTFCKHVRPCIAHALRTKSDMLALHDTFLDYMWGTYDNRFHALWSV